jgi:N-acetylglutamate synthase-like GNAT family acetyltransferase
MLESLSPQLHDGVYAFVTVPTDFEHPRLAAVATVVEREGLTLVLPESDAIRAGLDVLFRASWISLGVQSALAAVGLTAAVSRLLASEGIACNVIAGAHHDHLFVPATEGERALALLQGAQRQGEPIAERDGYSISCDTAAVDVDVVHAFLTTSYWAEGISRALVERAVRGSLNFSLFHGTSQVAFARVVTDRATFAYLCDVFVLDTHRGQGLGRWLIDTVMAHPDLQGLRRFSLGTRDAHSLYARVGFAPLRAPDRHMEIARPGIYLGNAD